MHDLAIRLIMQYLEVRLYEPRAGWPEDIFMERSTSRWAAFEIIERIMDRPFAPVEDTVEGFIFLMSALAHQAEHTPNAERFLIAIDTAEEILDILKGEHQ